MSQSRIVIIWSRMRQQVAPGCQQGSDSSDEQNPEDFTGHWTPSSLTPRGSYTQSPYRCNLPLRKKPCTHPATQRYENPKVSFRAIWKRQLKQRTGT